MVSQSIFSTPQWIAIVWSPRFSGLLSIVGSSLVIYMILSGGKSKTSHLQNRLLLGLSSFDIINSGALMASTAAFPSIFRTLIYGAVGTSTTCTIQGFFLGLGIAVPLYTAMLCINYLCVIKYNVHDETLRRWEKYMHLVALVPPLFLAVFSVVMDILHPTVKANCWASDGCELPNLMKQELALQKEQQQQDDDEDIELEEEQCTPRPQTIVNLSKFFATSLVILAILTIFYCMISIYLSVRKQSKTMAKYASFSKGNALNGSKRSKYSNNKQKHNQQHNHSVLQEVELGQMNDQMNDGSDNDTNSHPRCLIMASIKHVRESRAQSHSQSQSQSQYKRKGSSEETFTQAMLYVLAYFLCYIFSIIAQFMKEPCFPLMLLKAIFYPSQGFWNFFIYVRPRFVELRQKRKDESFWWIVRIILTGSKAIEEEERKKKEASRMSMIRRSSVMFYSGDGHAMLDGGSIKMNAKEGRRLSYSSVSLLESVAKAPANDLDTCADPDADANDVPASSNVDTDEPTEIEQTQPVTLDMEMNMTLPDDTNDIGINTQQ